jgi:methanethiol oxidase
MQQKTFRSKDMRRARTFATALLVTGLWLSGLPPTHADETCMSPYMAKITGQEDVVYVWTLGAEGVGDGSDKLVTVDVQPTSPTYGKVVHTASIGGRHEAHHAGFTDDRRYLWAGGLDTSQIFVFDIHSDPTTPRLAKTLTDFVAKSGGGVGPHTFYALPGRMLITGLSNDKDHGGRTALVEYTNEGEYITTHWMPTAENPRSAAIATVADGYGYDVRALPRKNIMLTSSFTGWSNYMFGCWKPQKVSIVGTIRLRAVFAQSEACYAAPCRLVRPESHKDGAVLYKTVERRVIPRYAV